MDFSSCTLSLQSLQRREPKITDPNIIYATDSLLEDIENGIKTNDSTNHIKELITYGVNNRWEALAVGLHLSIDYLSEIAKYKNNDNQSNYDALYTDGPRIPEMCDNQSNQNQNQNQNANASSHIQDLHLSQLLPFCQFLTNTCVDQLEHSEPRVRTMVAKLVGAHGQVSSLYLYESTTTNDFMQQRRQLYTRITSCLLLLIQSGREEQTLQTASDGSTVALDDTTGWKSLETSLLALAAFLDAPSATEQSELKHDLDTLIQSLHYCATKHINRHVRAASLQALERYINNACVQTPTQLIESKSKLQTLMVDILSITLADNWSQVRMAACTLCRALFQTLLNANLPMTSYFPKLLPRMCLNRFYLAQGVKLYSQQTWKIVLKDDGIQQVIRHIPPIVKYYVYCCDADNHVVREAACQAVAELAQKIGTHPQYSTYLEPFVPTLLQALIMCFHDESWPVRDQACIACGIFSKAYPQSSLPELPTLWERWSSQLTDQIWSVREGAAIALGDAMVAFDQTFQDQVIDYVKQLLPGAKDEEPMTQQQYEKRQNDHELHTNSQLYSCGSLAPKLRKGGCSDCIVTRPKAMWERTDGSIYMLREICVKIGSGELTMDNDILFPLFQQLADVARVNHFPQSNDLRSTLFKCLPDMAKGLGKKRFKSRYLNLFLDLLIRTLERGNANSSHSAEMCSKDLYNFIGEGIVKGRVKDVVGETGVLVLEKHVISFPRGCHNDRPMTEQFVSPFGPPSLTGNSNMNNPNFGAWGHEQAF